MGCTAVGGFRCGFCVCAWTRVLVWLCFYLPGCLPGCCPGCLSDCLPTYFPGHTRNCLLVLFLAVSLIVFLAVVLAVFLEFLLAIVLVGV